MTEIMYATIPTSYSNVRREIILTVLRRHGPFSRWQERQEASCPRPDASAP